MKARPIMLQGTSSNVGKSVLAAAFCRIFYQDGFHTAPFKAQNMALNSAVTPDSGEIGRAQYVQAEAAGVKPTVDMNPILMKPKQDMAAQIVVLGKPYADMTAKEYRNNFLINAHGLVQGCIDRLKEEYQVLVIEGAGSPVEVNLKDRDIVNMKTAELADSPVVLVADIDRGGVFAALIGTIELLEPEERKRIKGFIINKFRGDIDLLTPGLDFLEQRTGIPVLGVIPYIHNHGIDEEDSVWLSERNSERTTDRHIQDSNQVAVDIAIVQYPRISNFTDFHPLLRLPDTRVRFIKAGEPIGDSDIIILPGTKNTILDLQYLREHQYDEQISRHLQLGKRVIGICGGYQMLGRELCDPEGTEAGQGDYPGLGLLPIVTTFAHEKSTYQVETVISAAGRLDPGSELDSESAVASSLESKLKSQVVSHNQEQTLRGYEIHTGKTELTDDWEQIGQPLLQIIKRSGKQCTVTDGFITTDGRVWGSHVHGLFDNVSFLRKLMNQMRQEKGMPVLMEEQFTTYQREQSYNQLADIVRKSIDMKRLYEIVGLGRK